MRMRLFLLFLSYPNFHCCWFQVTISIFLGFLFFSSSPLQFSSKFAGKVAPCNFVLPHTKGGVIYPWSSGSVEGFEGGGWRDKRHSKGGIYQWWRQVALGQPPCPHIQLVPNHPTLSLGVGLVFLILPSTNLIVIMMGVKMRMTMMTLLTLATPRTPP